MLHFDLVEALVDIQIAGAFWNVFAIHFQTGECLANFDGAGVHPADGGDTAVIIVAKRGDENLQGRVKIHHGGWNVAQDGLEKRLEVRAEFGGETGLGGSGLGVDDREIGLLVGGAQFNEQVKGLVENAFGFCIFAVNFINNDHGFVAHFEGFLEHETGLRHGTFGSIHQQQHTVHHIHDAFHFAAEIGVTGCIHDVDLDRFASDRIRDGDGRVLGQDGDATLALEVVRVHHALGYLLVVTEGVRLAQETIHQGGFAMVDVGNDGNVTEIGACFEHKSAFRVELSAISFQQ